VIPPTGIPENPPSRHCSYCYRSCQYRPIHSAGFHILCAGKTYLDAFMAPAPSPIVSCSYSEPGPGFHKYEFMRPLFSLIFQSLGLPVIATRGAKPGHQPTGRILPGRPAWGAVSECITGNPALRLHSIKLEITYGDPLSP
jgi:hypothetical protein